MYDDTSVGAFWEKTTKDGKKYLSGHIYPDKIKGTGKVNVNIFPNRKGKPTHPDHRIYRPGEEI